MRRNVDFISNIGSIVAFFGVLLTINGPVIAGQGSFDTDFKNYKTWKWSNFLITKSCKMHINEFGRIFSGFTLIYFTLNLS